jgi:glycosyltransferase-like protein LARGE
VDVDFRPSCNLFGMLHSQYAAESAMENRRAIVCPAFEYIKGSTYPYCISNLKELVDNGQAEGFHLSSFPQGHEPTQFDKFWEKSLQCQDDEKEDQHISNFWQESYEIEHKELFEPYIVMASADVPLYDERFQGYGLNKLSHLASVSKLKSGKFFVLPGVFLVAPTHDRSESWTKIYGKVRSEDTEINQLKLKGLYHNFKKRLRHDQEPIVSKDTQLKQQQLRRKETRKKR